MWSETRTLPAFDVFFPIVCQAAAGACQTVCPIHTIRVQWVGRALSPVVWRVSCVRKKGEEKKHWARASNLRATRSTDHVPSYRPFGACQFDCHSRGGTFSSPRPSRPSPDAHIECVWSSQPLYTRHSQSSLEKRPHFVRKRSLVSRSFFPRRVGYHCVLPIKQLYYPPRVSVWSVKRLNCIC